MESLNNLYQVIDKVGTLNSLFGLIVICVIAGCVLVLYSRHINRFYKPLRIVLQFCMAAFLSFGLIGLVALAVTNFVGQFYVALFLSLGLSGAISLAALFLINRKNKKVKDLRNQKELAEKNLAEALKTGDELRENLRKLESEKSALENNIANLKSDISDKLGTTNSELENLRKNNDALEAEKSELAKKCDNLRQENDTLKNQRAKITSSLIAGATEFNGHHYEVFLEDISWEAARQRCENMGGHLATITSQAMQDFIVKNFLRTSPGWLKWLKSYWIGGYTNDNKECFWVTGEKWEYSNLGANDVIASNAKLRIYGFMNNGEWSFSSDNSTADSYICEWDF